MIESFLSFPLDDILNANLNQSLIIKALETVVLYDNAIDKELIETFSIANIWDSIQQIRKVLAHPYPQAEGLLNLVTRDIEGTEKVTRTNVMIYITELIEAEIKKIEQSPVDRGPINFKQVMTYLKDNLHFKVSREEPETVSSKNKQTLGKN